MQKGSLKGYLFRFSLVHVIIYVFIALLFRNYLNYNEQFTSSVLYNNFRNIDSTIMRFAPLFQLGRGLFLGLIIYPVYNCIIGVKYGWLRLFALLWGLSLIGSVAATPGSIEGFIYTKTPIIEHLLGLPEVTLQTMLFSLIFVSWEKRRFNKRLQRKEIIEESTKEE
ncbi:MAG TPA: hypothetical protein VKN64_10740 [Halanaerobiales bacterium]|nr:hypothetical protein [Halanaerobiales bacterium]